MDEGDTPDTKLSPLLGGGHAPDLIAERDALATMRRTMFGREATPLQLSRYVVLEQLGRGGSGLVLKAYDPLLERNVAIKLVRPDGDAAEDPATARARLLREAQALAQISSPHVVAIHDVGSFGDDELDAAHPELRDGGVFIVMELIDGVTLAKWWRASSRSVDEIVAKLEDAARGLAAAHALGIVHRDFKPGNAIVGSDGRVRVVDFGLARAAAPIRDDDPVGDRLADASNPGMHVEITRAGTTMGTPSFMSPEQHRGDAIDDRTDVYAWCVTAFQALTGRSPFTASSLPALLEAKQRQPALGSSTQQEIPAGLRSLLVRGLDPDPARRPRMGAVLAVLGRLEARRRRTRRVLAVGGVLSVAGVLVGGRVLSVRSCRAEVEAAAAAMLERSAAVHDERAMSATPSAIADGRVVSQQLDRWAQAWTTDRAATCGSWTALADERARQTAGCLDQLVAEFDSVADLLESPELTAMQAITVVGLLPAIPPCHRSVDPGEVTSPDVARALARAWTLLDGDQPMRAAEIAEAIASQAPEGSFVQARAQLTIATAAIEEGQVERGEAMLLAILERARERGYADVALRAATRLLLMYTEAPVQRRAGEVLLATVAGGPLDAESAVLRSAFLEAAAKFHREAGNPEQAWSRFLAAGDAMAEVLEPDHLIRIGHDLNAPAVAPPEAMAAALEQATAALARAEPILAGHPYLARGYLNVGSAHAVGGDFESAVRFLDRAVATHESLQGKGSLPWIAAVDSRSVAYVRLGDLEAANRGFASAVGAAERFGDERRLIVPYKNAGLGRVAVGDHDGALELFDRALAIADATELEGPKRDELEGYRQQCLEALGRRGTGRIVGPAG